MGGTAQPLGMAAKLVALLAAFVATSVVGGLLVAGLVMPAVGATGSVARSSVDFFDTLPEELEPRPLSQQSRILWSDGSLMATFYDQNRIVVPLAAMSPLLQQATIAIEDARFYEHNGIDPQGISRAAVSNFSGNDPQGASTLTQQWIKNVLLQEARSTDDTELEQSLLTEDLGRKVREWKLALAVEERLTKEQILENYLNIALFGDNQFGVATASNYWFGKAASDLALHDAAMLAGIIQSPSRFDPLDNPAEALTRRNVVLARMLELGMIDQPSYDAAVAVPLEAQLNVQPSRNGCEQAGNAAYFCDYVIQSILTNPAYGETQELRQELIYRGGLTITTTLERPRQDLADAAVKGAADPTDGAASSIVSVQPGTGRIVAMAQNRNYDPREGAAPGGTSYNYNVDASMGGPPSGFQVGSTYKPFVLVQWLASGRSLNDRVNVPAAPSYQTRRDFQACDRSILGGEWEPKNAGDGNANGNLSVLEATFNSVNTAFTEMTRQLDLCAIRDRATDLGVHRTDGADLDLFPSATLGTNEIAPLTMASAYAAFAENGTFCNPQAIAEIKDAAGTVIAAPQPECRQAIDAGIANAVAFALTNTIERGTARGIGGIGRPAAGKTGTTNGSVETWFVGFTPQLSTAVWVGTPDSAASGAPQELNGLTIGGERYGTVYGGTIAAPTWKAYMEPAHDGLPVEGFAPAPGQFFREPPPPPGPTPDNPAQAAGDGRGEEDVDRGDVARAFDEWLRNNGGGRPGGGNNGGGQPVEPPD